MTTVSPATTKIIAVLRLGRDLDKHSPLEIIFEQFTQGSSPQRIPRALLIVSML
jgi:hypothetical protein